MKLVVDTTLPPAQFQAALIEAARRARAEHQYIRNRARDFEACGWGAQAARELAEFELLIQRGDLQ